MPQMLSIEALDRARAFVDATARPLDRALLHDDSAGALEALKAYQNPDGGFGHGLEPDVPTPASTALATSVGLRMLRSAGAAADHPMVAAAIGWLDRTLDRAAGVWPIITPEVDKAPHAPWWSWSKDLAENWNGFRFNPSAELLGYLYLWQDAAPAALLEAVEAGMRRTLRETGAIEGAYDLKCAIRLAETPGAPEDLRAELAALCVRSTLAHADDDVHGSAVEFATRPDGLLANPLAARIGPALDAMVAAQEGDGGWPLFWDWAFIDANAWAKARRDWRGLLARENLETLRAWGRTP